MEQLVLSRRSCRRYLDKNVEPQMIDRILNAMQAAPAGGNSSSVEYTVICGAPHLFIAHEKCSGKWAEDSKVYYGAPLVLFVCYDKTACWTHPQSGKSSGATDGTIVAAHMMLEAASIGLGTVWISYFDEDKARELLKLPDIWQPVCMLYIGYPADDFVPNTKLGCHRKPLSETCFYNQAPLK